MAPAQFVFFNEMERAVLVQAFKLIYSMPVQLELFINTTEMCFLVSFTLSGRRMTA